MQASKKNSVTNEFPRQWILLKWFVFCKNPIARINHLETVLMLKFCTAMGVETVYPSFSPADQHLQKPEVFVYL